MNDEGEDDAHQHEFIIENVSSHPWMIFSGFRIYILFDEIQGAEDINGDEDEVFEGDMDGDMSEMGDIDGKSRPRLSPGKPATDSHLLSSIPEEGIFDDEEDDEEGDPGMDDDEGSEIFEEMWVIP